MQSVGIGTAFHNALSRTLLRRHKAEPPRQGTPPRCRIMPMRRDIKVAANVGSLELRDDHTRMRLHEPFARSHVEKEP